MNEENRMMGRAHRPTPASRQLGFQVKAQFKSAWLFGWDHLRPRATSPTYLRDADVLGIVPKEFRHIHSQIWSNKILLFEKFTRKDTDTLTSVAHSAIDLGIFSVLEF